MLRRLAVFGYVVVLASSLALASAAKPTSSNPRASALASQIKSPFCPGQSLSSCSSPAAAVWRADIRQWVDEGVSSEQIKERLSTRANVDLRVVPNDNTLSPLLFLGATAGFAGLFVVARIMRKRPAVPRDEEVAVSVSPNEAALDRQLDDELAFYD